MERALALEVENPPSDPAISYIPSKSFQKWFLSAEPSLNFSTFHPDLSKPNPANKNTTRRRGNKKDKEKKDSRREREAVKKENDAGREI